jgi:hypothetical protein
MVDTSIGCSLRAVAETVKSGIGTALGFQTRPKLIDRNEGIMPPSASSAPSAS